MTKHRGILIKNIYYMLSYAFHILKESTYDEIASEEFENLPDLFAAILAKGITRQVKQGLYREYVTECDNLPAMRGKLHIHETINNKLHRKQVLFCEYDEFSENNIFNQILKTTAFILLRQPNLNPEHKTTLKKAMLFFDSVDVIDSSAIKWNMLRFRRNNQNYIMLINICYFVLNNLLLTTEKGKYKLTTFFDDQGMARLFEKFVLEYYRYHYPFLRPNPAQIKWKLDDVNNRSIDYLPIMETDVMLRYKEKTLIIDTKFYSRIMQTNTLYDSQTIRSSHLYQIFTYVKNYDAGNTGNVAGLLLYAKTDEGITPDYDFQIGGNKISVKTLDLNVPFSAIAAQLNEIVDSYFGI